MVPHQPGRYRSRFCNSWSNEWINLHSVMSWPSWISSILQPRLPLESTAPSTLRLPLNLSKFASWEGGPCPRLKVECHARANQLLNLGCLLAREAMSQIFEAVEIEL